MLSNTAKRDSIMQATKIIRNIMRKYNVQSNNLWTNTYANSKTIKCFANVYEAHAIKMECEALNYRTRIDTTNNYIRFTRGDDLFAVIVNV
jgi:hypothetical protein